MTAAGEMPTTAPVSPVAASFQSALGVGASSAGALPFGGDVQASPTR